MGFDLVIFDCDGVSIDSELLSVRADIACLTEDGIELSEDEILQRYTGISMAGMLAISSSATAAGCPSSQSGTVCCCRSCLPQSSAPSSASRRCSTASRSSSASRRAAHRSGFGSGYHRWASTTGFTRTSSARATMVEHGKPGAGPVDAAAQMAAPPERCVVIEDSLPGIAAAIAAGMISGPGSPAAAIAGRATRRGSQMPARCKSPHKCPSCRTILYRNRPADPVCVGCACRPVRAHSRRSGERRGNVAICPALVVLSLAAAAPRPLPFPLMLLHTSALSCLPSPAPNPSTTSAITAPPPTAGLLVVARHTDGFAAATNQSPTSTGGTESVRQHTCARLPLSMLVPAHHHRRHTPPSSPAPRTTPAAIR